MLICTCNLQVSFFFVIPCIPPPPPIVEMVAIYFLAVFILCFSKMLGCTYGVINVTIWMSPANCPRGQCFTAPWCPSHLFKIALPFCTGWAPHLWPGYSSNLFLVNLFFYMPFLLSYMLPCAVVFLFFFSCFYSQVKRFLRGHEHLGPLQSTIRLDVTC